MTPEEKKIIADNVEKAMRRAEIFEVGIQSDFWKELKAMLAELSQDAFDKFCDTPTELRDQIAELQQVGKLGKVLEAHVLSTIDAAKELAQ